MASAGLRKVYDDIDLPMSPVLARMEAAGIKIDTEVLAEMSQRLERDASQKAREIWEKCGTEFNINSPKQLGDVLFNKLNLPKPVKYGKGKTISTAVDVLEGLAAEHEVPRMVLGLSPAHQAEVHVRGCAARAAEPATRRLHTTFNMAGSATGRLSSINPEPAEHSDSHRAGPRDSCRLRRRAGQPAARGRLLANRVAAAGAFLRRPVAGGGVSHRARHPHAHGFASLWRAGRLKLTPNIAAAPRR